MDRGRDQISESTPGVTNQLFIPRGWDPIRQLSHKACQESQSLKPIRKGTQKAARECIARKAFQHEGLKAQYLGLSGDVFVELLKWSTWRLIKEKNDRI
ncbi:hypothetical protein GN956_G18864 [Arapaima gigas]